MNVLHVEDDRVDAMAFQRALDDLDVDWPVTVAQDGEEALALLEEGEVSPPRVVILDLSMPRMDGITFLETLRGDDDLAQELVVVLTSSENAYDRRRCYQLNVAGYVVKPFDHDGLVDAVRTIVAYLRLVELPRTGVERSEQAPSGVTDEPPA